MNKKYQTNHADTTPPAVPETVNVALGELAGEMREGLLALAVGTGLQVMTAIMEEDVSAACGPKGRHDTDWCDRRARCRSSVSVGVDDPATAAIDNDAGAGTALFRSRLA